jgi:hypothetical protein
MASLATSRPWSLSTAKLAITRPLLASITPARTGLCTLSYLIAYAGAAWIRLTALAKTACVDNRQPLAEADLVACDRDAGTAIWRAFSARGTWLATRRIHCAASSDS